MADLDCPSTERRGASVGITTREHEFASAGFGEATRVRAVYRGAPCDRFPVGVHQYGRTAVFDAGGEVLRDPSAVFQSTSAEGDVAAGAKGIGVVDLDRASAHRGCAIVGVAGAEREGAGIRFGQRPRAADDAGEGLVVCARVDEVAAVCDSFGVASSSELSCWADLERAVADGGCSAVGIVARECERARAVFGEVACGGGDHATDRGVPGTTDGEGKSAADRTGEGEQAGVGINACGGGEGDGPRVGVVAGDIAQGAAGADACAREAEGFGSNADAARELEGGSAGHGRADRRGTQRVGVCGAQGTRRDCGGGRIGVVAVENEGAGAGFTKSAGSVGGPDNAVDLGPRVENLNVT